MSDRGVFEGAAIIGALADGRVDFIVIGGLAVIAHGYARTTDDIDIVPGPDRENLARLAAVLKRLDYRIHGVDEFEADELVHPDLENLLAGRSWVLATQYGGLDILQNPEPDLDYESLRRRAFIDTVFGHRVQFCGYDDLVAMKEAAGRPGDLKDLQRLRALRDNE